MHVRYTIYVNPIDIYVFAVGLSGGSADIEVELIRCSPEERLEKIMEWLGVRGVGHEQVSDVVCVVGPGSATALRSMLAGLNAWKVVRKDVRLWALRDNGALEGEVQKRIFREVLNGERGDEVDVLVPVYMHEPRITISQKDALKR